MVFFIEKWSLIWLWKDYYYKLKLVRRFIKCWLGNIIFENKIKGVFKIKIFKLIILKNINLNECCIKDNDWI